MIRISCTNCKTVLSIDDAFAGGVCRCQHCGTIQTVPAHARDTAQVAASGQAMGGSKSLYQQGDTRSGTGLDELAGIVVSSGLSSSRLTKRAAAKSPASKLNLMPLMLGGGVVIAILIVIIIYLATRPATPREVTTGNTTDSNINRTSGITAVPVINSPNFCNTPLDGNNIIYLLDCGDSSKDYLGELKDATIKSIGTLGSERKFQILFWNDGTTGAYPLTSTTYATKESIDSAEKAIADVFAYGAGDVKTALTKAIAEQPDEIVLATTKGWQLDPAWLVSVMAIRGSSTVKFITYSLGPADNKCETLKELAEKTGGSYHEATQADLRSFAQ